MIAAVTFGALIELIWVTTLTTLSLVTAFALGLRWTAHAADLRRERRTVAAAFWGTAALLCYVFVAAAVVAAVLIIATG